MEEDVHGKRLAHLLTLLILDASQAVSPVMAGVQQGNNGTQMQPQWTFDLIRIHSFSKESIQICWLDMQKVSTNYNHLHQSMFLVDPWKKISQNIGLLFTISISKKEPQVYNDPWIQGKRNLFFPLQTPETILKDTKICLLETCFHILFIWNLGPISCRSTFFRSFRFCVQNFKLWMDPFGKSVRVNPQGFTWQSVFEIWTSGVFLNMKLNTKTVWKDNQLSSSCRHHSSCSLPLRISLIPQE